jgi:HSP20 family protein
MSSTSGSDPTNQVLGIEETIGRMERLYRAVTGRDAPPGETAYAPIPVERDPGEYVEEQMSKLLDLLGQSDRAPAPVPTWMPPVTVCESGPELLIRMDLPGISREQVDVTAHGNVLTVSGTRPAPSSGNGSLRLAECPHGAFRRTFVLPAARRGAEPSARMKDGVLEIRIARDTSHAEPPRPVPVN